LVFSLFRRRRGNRLVYGKIAFRTLGAPPGEFCGKKLALHLDPKNQRRNSLFVIRAPKKK